MYKLDKVYLVTYAPDIFFGDKILILGVYSSEVKAIEASKKINSHCDIQVMYINNENPNE